MYVEFLKYSVKVCRGIIPFEFVSPLKILLLVIFVILTVAFCRLFVEFLTVTPRYHFTVIEPVAPVSKPMSVFVNVTLVRVPAPSSILMSFEFIAVRLSSVNVLFEPPFR